MSQPVKAPSVSIETAPLPKAARKEEPVLLRSQDARGVVTLTLNRPHAFNALSEAMLLALQRELDAIAHDETVRVIVLAAEGKAFCAGHDLKEMRAAPSLDYYDGLFVECADMMLAIQRLHVLESAGVHRQESDPVDPRPEALTFISLKYLAKLRRD